MRVLLLYKYSNHLSLIQDMVSDLYRRGVDIHALDVVRFHCISNSRTHRSPHWVIGVLLKVPKLRGFLLRAYRDTWIARYAKHYDIVDIHAFSSQYANLIKLLHKERKKIVVTYWGSDLLRASKDELESQKKLLGMITCIRTTSPASYAVVGNWKRDIPIHMCRFGVGRLHAIKSINSLPSDEITKRVRPIVPELTSEKVLLAIGNNGSPQQQHQKILQELDKLPARFKKQLVILVPASYGLTKKYRGELAESLKKGGWEYTILDKYLSVERLSEIIARTDIYITAQVTDAFSSYVQEHLASGSVVLAGKWLPYFVLRRDGIHIIDFDFSVLKEKVENVLKNLAELKAECGLQNAQIHDLSSWATLGKCWRDSYSQLLTALR